LPIALGGPENQWQSIVYWLDALKPSGCRRDVTWHDEFPPALGERLNWARRSPHPCYHTGPKPHGGLWTL